MKTISVNIVMTYPVHWSKYQVLHDFVQNFYDAVGFNDWRQNFHYYGKDAFTFRENSIVVTIPFTRIRDQQVGNEVGNEVGK